MKRIRMTYTLTLKDGRQIAVNANNKVEAFDKMAFLFPAETEGHSFREIEARYAGTEVR